ncbi:hypothetical protein SMD44_p10097 (plasmid) [Streptomyces alboflavus]|uniref:Uncharacterized protein n=1 Tax=Streptomyces alboflavus TaxID=67267 RepID=A0A291W4L4_9ACTN|nr:hypothetical protein SMD44_p10097 [Streptomyces alboflavus]
MTREALNASIPVALDIPYRFDVLKVVSGINHIPPADLASIAVDWFLRGGTGTAEDMLPPWDSYRGPGVQEDIPLAEDVLQKRFIKREPLKWQVPEALELNKRLSMYRLLNRLSKVPAGDIVTVAIDRWLRMMGY